MGCSFLDQIVTWLADSFLMRACQSIHQLLFVFLPGEGPVLGIWGSLRRTLSHPCKEVSLSGEMKPRRSSCIESSQDE